MPGIVNVSGWDQPHRVAQFAKLPRPVRPPATSLQCHKIGRLPREKLEHLGPHQALAEHHPAGRIGPVRLEYPLRNIQPDRASLAHGRLPWWLLNTTTLAHRCRRGASTPSRPHMAAPTSVAELQETLANGEPSTQGRMQPALHHSRTGSEASRQCHAFHCKAPAP